MQLNEKQIAALNEYRAAKRAPSQNAPALTAREKAGRTLEQYGAGLATAASYAASGMDDELMARITAAGTLPITGAIDVANRLGANIPNPMAGKSWDEIVSAEENRNRAQNKELIDKADLTTSIVGGVLGTAINPLSRLFPNSMTAQGAIVSGAQNFGEGENGIGDRIVRGVEGAVKGAAFGLAGDVLVKGGGAALNYLGKKTNPPAALEKITEYRRKAYKYIEDSDFVINPEKMTEIGQKIATRVLPKTAQELELMKRGNKAVIQKVNEFDEIMAGKPTTLKAMRMYDASLNDAITDSIKLGNKATTDTKYLYDLQDEFRASLDEAAEGLPPAARDANFLNTQERKIGDIFRILENASYTQNPGTYVNTRFKHILDKGRGWSDVDKQFIKMILKEDFGDEALRAIGSRLSAIGQLAQGNLGASLLQSGVSSLARNAKDARKLAKVDRLVTHLGRESAKRIKQMEYINAPKSTPSVTPDAPATQPKPQLLLPAPQTPIAVTRQGQAAPMTAEELAQASATRQAMQESGRLEALRAQQPPIQNFPDPRVPPVKEIPDYPEKALFDEASAIKKSLKMQFSGNIEREIVKRLGYKPMSLRTFVAQRGGISKSGETAGRDLTNRTQVGMVRQKGTQLDYAKQSAWENGYFPQARSADDISDSDFYDALRSDKVYPFEDQLKIEEITRQLAPDEYVERLGITPDMSIKEIVSRIKSFAKDESGKASIPLSAGAGGAAAYALSPQDAKAQTLTQEQQNALIEYRAMKGKEQPTRINIAPPVNGQDPLQGTQGVPDVQLPATIPDQSSLTQQNEGLRLSTYMDTTGNPTIGYGNNLKSPVTKRAWKEAGIQTPYADAYKGRAAITPDEAQRLYQVSESIARKDAEAVYGRLTRYTPNQQIALADLSYQLGLPTLKGFKNFNAAMKKGDTFTAVNHLMKSKLATQTPERVKRITQLLLS